MPVVAGGELYMTTVTGVYLGQLIENVLMFRERTGASTNAEIAASTQSFWTSFRKMFAPSFTLTYIQSKRMTPIALDTQFVAPVPGENAGGDDGEGTNCTVAVVVTLRTGTAGKRHRGRVYLGCSSLSRHTSNDTRMSAAGLANYNAVWDEILGKFDDATGTDEHLALGIYSRVIGGTNPYTVAGWQAVTQAVVQPILGNQRRRRPGVGA